MNRIRNRFGTRMANFQVGENRMEQGLRNLVP